MINNIKGSLVLKSGVRTLILAFVLGIGMSVFQIALDYENENTLLNKSVNSIAEMQKKTAYEAVYSLDFVLAEKIAEGFFQYDPMSRVQIIDTSGSVIVDRKTSKGNRISDFIGAYLFGNKRIYSYSLHSEYENVIIGRLILTVDCRYIAKSFIKRSLLMFLGYAALNVGLALIVMIVLYFSILKPFRLIIKEISEVDSRNPGSKDIVPIQGHEHDEIGMLSNALSFLLKRFDKALKESEESSIKLKESEERYRGIFDNATDGIFRISKEGKLETVNESFAKIFGYVGKEKIIYDFNQGYISIKASPVYDTDIIYDLMSVVRRGTFEGIMSGGANVSLNCSLSSVAVLDEEKNIKYYDCVIRDYTYSKKTQELQDAVEKAVSECMVKSEFISNVSHEIRTPMNAVIGFADILYDEIKDEKLYTYVDAIKNSGEVLLALINDILDMSKIESGKLDLKPEPVNIRSVIYEIRDMFSLQIEDKGVDFQLVIGSEVPDTIFIDGMRLRQILVNIVGNAAKFTDEGFIKLSLNAVVKDDSCCSIILEVEDSGVGIDPEFKDMIFESYIQYSPKSGRRYEGTGLGLAISKKLIELLDGGIEVRSELGLGSVFTLSFDNVEIVKDSIYLDKKLLESKTIYEFRDTNVVVADDNSYNRFLLRKILESSGAKVFESSDGNETVRLIKSHRPDIVLLDLKMPVMSGFDVARNVYAEPSLKDIPIIAVTADNRNETRLEAFSCGCVAFITKPIKKEKLLKVMVDFLPDNKVVNLKSVMPEQKNIRLKHIFDNEFLPEINLLLKKYNYKKAELLLDNIENFAAANNIQEFNIIIKNFDKNILNKKLWMEFFKKIMETAQVVW